MLPGTPLTTEMASGMSPRAVNRLAVDLATFFRQTQAIPLADACAWLGTPFQGAATVATLAEDRGKPLWFSASPIAEIRSCIETVLDRNERRVFDATVGQFGALDVIPAFMVFGHGDIHGYNVAMGEDDVGPKVAGIRHLRSGLCRHPGRPRGFPPPEPGE